MRAPKSDRQIIKDCNALADRFHQTQGLVSRPRFKYYEANLKISSGRG